MSLITNRIQIFVRCILRYRLCLLLTWFLSHGLSQQASAVEPPKIQRALPAGGQISKTHEVILTGTFPTWPTEFWTDSSDLTIKALETSGKIAITVAADAEPGVRYYRAYNAAGVSDMIPFIIDRCADLLEQEPNDHHAKAQPVDLLPASVHGHLEKSGDVDTFQVFLGKGETLIASLNGQRFLASPMDADIQILTTRGIVLAQQFDHHGLDPEIKFVAPADGAYLVRLMAFPGTPDSTIAYAGGEKFVYRLILTKGPFIDTTWPACLSRQQENHLQLIGANIPPDSSQIHLPSLGPSTDLALMDRKWFSVFGFQGIVDLPITSSAVLVESEPNELEAPVEISVPCIVTGCISTQEDRDAFQFVSEAGQRWKLSIEAREFGSALDSVLTVFNSEGKQLATSDDVGDNRDATLSFAVPAAGKFTVRVQDLNHHSSPQHWYRLIIQSDQPDFSLSTTGNAFTGKVGQPVEIAVNLERKLDFAGDVTVSFDRPLPSGVNPQVISKKSDDSAKTVKLVIQSEQPLSHPIRIIGLSPSGRSHLAKPEKGESNWLWLTVTN